MDPHVKEYLAAIGRIGGRKSLRTLAPETARRMVAVREARRCSSSDPMGHGHVGRRVAGGSCVQVRRQSGGKLTMNGRDTMSSEPKSSPARRTYVVSRNWPDSSTSSDSVTGAPGAIAVSPIG
jgi:hypothetical protein